MLEEENQMGLFEILGFPPDRSALEATQPAPPSAIPAPTSAIPTPPSPKPAPMSAAKPAVVPSGKRAKPATSSSAKPGTLTGARTGKKASAPSAASAPATKAVSGLVPDGDVRLTANIRQDLHLKIKIASAHRRTTIGEILEELIEKHIK